MAENGKQPQLEVTSGTQWRKLREEGVIVTLPSGNVARLRPLGIPALIRSGKIPDLLSGLAAEVVWNDQPSSKQIQQSVDLAKGSIELLDIVTQEAFLEPRIVAEPSKDDEISVDDVSLADKYFVMTFVSAPTQALAKFRAEQTAGVDAVPDGQGVEQPTQ